MYGDPAKILRKARGCCGSRTRAEFFSIRLYQSLDGLIPDRAL
jgi:hypothetical protein